MSDLNSQIEALKTKAEQVKAAKYRAEAAREAAEATQVQAMQTLQTRFGLDDLGSARAKLAELEADLEQKVLEATAILDNNNF